MYKYGTNQPIYRANKGYKGGKQAEENNKYKGQKDNRYRDQDNV